MRFILVKYINTIHISDEMYIFALSKEIETHENAFFSMIGSEWIVWSVSWTLCKRKIQNSKLKKRREKEEKIEKT